MKRILLYNFLLLSMLFSITAVAKEDTPYEKSREKIYRYGINPSTQLYITNSYGNVSLKAWDKDSILVIVRIIARAKSMVETERLLDYATIEEYSGPISVMFKTVFGKNASIVERSKLGIQEAVGDREVGVEYTVLAPSHLICNFENRFGDIFLPDWRANLFLSLSYGDIRGGSCKGTINLDLKYGKAFFSSLEKIAIDGTYAELHADKVNSLGTKSLSTKYTIEKCGVMKLQSKNDKFYITSCEGFTGNTFLTVINIDQLNGNVNLSSKYGELGIGSVSAKVAYLQLKGNSTDYSFGFDNDCTASVDLTMKSEKYLSYSPLFKVQKDERFDKIHHMILKKGAEPRTKITMDATSAYINLK